MGISADEYIALGKAGALSRKGVFGAKPVNSCKKCGVGIQETITGNRLMDDGIVCSDCYFEIVGREVDYHPIGMPRTRRGA